jgi:sulfate permease, SulP family
VVAAIGLIDPAAWRSLARVHRMEVVLAAIAAIGVVTVGVLPAIGIAVALSIVDVVARSAHPHDAVLGWVERLGRYADVSMHPSARVTPGIVVYRLDDRLIFTNSRYVVARVGEAIVAAPSPTRWLVFDAEGVTNIDASGVDALGQLVTRLEADGITLTIARIKGPMVRNLDDAGFLDRIGHDRVYPTVRAAVEACPGPGPGAGAAPGESPHQG